MLPGNAGDGAAVGMAAGEERTRSLRAEGAAGRSALRNLAEFTHELRTPLHSVLASVELLLDEPALTTNDLVKAHLVRIEHAATHLTELVDQFLTCAADDFRARCIAAPVDLAFVAEQVASIVYPLAAAGGLEFSVNVMATCPYFGSAGELRQILLNLLGNAVKFTAAGEVGFSIRCSMDRVEIEVWDTGHGIPTDYLPRIFDPFFRVPGSDGFGGSGLGLTAVAAQVDALGGTIEVASQMGIGTHFHIRIPTGVNASPVI
jgi:signal transduction histidine kinase